MHFDGIALSSVIGYKMVEKDHRITTAKAFLRNIAGENGFGIKRETHGEGGLIGTKVINRMLPDKDFIQIVWTHRFFPFGPRNIPTASKRSPYPSLWSGLASALARSSFKAANRASG